MKKIACLATALLMLAGIPAARAANIIVYNNLNVQPTSNYGELDSNNLIAGDALTLTQGGKLTLFGLTLFNSPAGGNTGSIVSGTMRVTFYDNTTPYTSGTLADPIVGAVTLPINLGGGLAVGNASALTFNLAPNNITLPQNILVTQQFTQTSGTSTASGVLLRGDPIVGSSPATVYLNSSATTEGLYPIASNAGQFGYEVEISDVAAAPLPGAFVGGLALLAGMGLVKAIRKPAKV